MIPGKVYLWKLSLIQEISTYSTPSVEISTCSGFSVRDRSWQLTRSNCVQMAFATVHSKHVHVNIRSRPFLYIEYRSSVKFIRATLKYVHISEINANFHVLTLAGIHWNYIVNISEFNQTLDSCNSKSENHTDANTVWHDPIFQSISHL